MIFEAILNRDPAPIMQANPSLPFDPAYLSGDSDQSAGGDDDAAPLAGHYFNFRKTSIYGGSNEIQKNIITQMILGL